MNAEYDDRTPIARAEYDDGEWEVKELPLETVLDAVLRTNEAALTSHGLTRDQVAASVEARRAAAIIARGSKRFLAELIRLSPRNVRSPYFRIDTTGDD